MKILFISKFVGQGSVEILSNLRWFGKDQPLITEMSDEHIRNARVWLFNKIVALRNLGYPLPTNNGFCYDQWLVILADEENRRQNIIEKARLDEIEMLRVAAMSTGMRKSKARKLLQDPSEENINEAKKLLQIKSIDEKTRSKKQNDLGFSIKTFAVYDTFDHAWDAHESQMSHEGW